MKIVKNILLVLLVFVILSTGAYAVACNVQGEVFDSEGVALTLGVSVDCVLYRISGSTETYTTTTGTNFPPVSSFDNNYKCDMNCDELSGGDIIEVIVYDSVNPGIASTVMDSSTTYLDVALGQDDVLEISFPSGNENKDDISEFDIEIISTSSDYDLLSNKLTISVLVENKLQKVYLDLSANFILKDSKGEILIDFTRLIELDAFERKEIKFSGQGDLEKGLHSVDFSLYYGDKLLDATTFEFFVSSEKEDSPLPEQVEESIEEGGSKDSGVTLTPTFVGFFILFILIIGLIVYYLLKKKKEDNERN